MSILISIRKTLLQVSTAVISNSVDVTSLVNPAQLTDGVGMETVFPVVEGVVGFGLEPVVKETRPVVAGATFPVVAGLAGEVVSGLGASFTEVVSGF